MFYLSYERIKSVWRILRLVLQGVSWLRAGRGGEGEGEMILTRIYKDTGLSIHQSLMPNGKYRLDEEIQYYSPRYKKTITVPPGYPSDGATGAFDTVSRYWWVHDLLCDRGTFDDGTPLTNWQCSQVLQDILVEESQMFKGRERFYVWFASKYRFWATFAMGGGKCRKNGMLRLAAMLLVTVLMAGCHSVAAPKTIQVEAGTGVRHEVGESPVKTNTAIVRATWELRK